MLPVELVFQGIFFFSDFVSVIKIIQKKFTIPEEIFPVVESQPCEQSMILVVIGSPLASAVPSTFFEFYLLQLHLSSYICHHKDQSKRKLALQQDDLIHTTDETVENCANSLCISRQFEYAVDPLQMRRRPISLFRSRSGRSHATLPVPTSAWGKGTLPDYGPSGCKGD